MKVIIAGTRTITDRELLDRAALDSGFDITTVICGCAEGVDKMGGHCYDELLDLWIRADECGQESLGMAHCWACRHNVPVMHFPAEWKKHGRGAGPIRNEQMADEGEALIALWDGTSRGTSSMIKLADEAGLPVYVTWPSNT